MSQPMDEARVARLRTLRRFRLPVGLAGAAAFAFVTLRFWPDPDFANYKRVWYSNTVAFATVLVLCTWFVLDGPFRLRFRLLTFAGLLTIAAGGALSIRTVEFTGDMGIILHSRFARPRDDLLDAARREQGSKSITTSIDVTIRPDDFPEYRGRLRSGVVATVPLARDWTQYPPRVIWKQPIGGGYAGFAVAGNIAVTIEQRRDNETIVCYDRSTASERWVHAYPAHFKEAMGGPGPRATPTIHAGMVYSLGAAGQLVCLDARTGDSIWSVNILEDNDARNLPWGMAGSPLVLDREVIVCPGGRNASLAAYDRQTGRKNWIAGDQPAAYSSAMIATLTGVRQILIFDGTGIAGFDDTGLGEMWRHRWITPPQNINVAQPLVLDGNRVFISSGYGVGCAMLQVERSNSTFVVVEVWKSNAMNCKFTSPVESSGFLFGLDDGILVCVDAANGRRKWKRGRYGHGQILLCRDVIIVLTESGEIVLVEATSDAHRELARFAALEGKTWNPHALAGNQLFVRNHLEMACIELPVDRSR